LGTLSEMDGVTVDASIDAAITTKDAPVMSIDGVVPPVAPDACADAIRAGGIVPAHWQL
jgi:hypothetical protein